MSGGTLKAKMRRALLAAGAVAAALSISACLPAVTAGTQAGAARPWEVRFESSGGIAGMAKQMTVFHDGRLVAENLRHRVSVEKSLPSDQLRELHRLIEQAESAPGMAMGFLDRCADCTQYRLTYTIRPQCSGRRR